MSILLYSSVSCKKDIYIDIQELNTCIHISIYKMYIIE